MPRSVANDLSILRDVILKAQETRRKNAGLEEYLRRAEGFLLWVKTNGNHFPVRSDIENLPSIAGHVDGASDSDCKASA